MRVVNNSIKIEDGFLSGQYGPGFRHLRFQWEICACIHYIGNNIDHSEAA